MSTLADQVRARLSAEPAIDKEAQLVVVRARIALLSGSRKGVDGIRAPTSFFGALAMRLTPVEDRSLDKPMASDGTVLRYQPELVRQANPHDLESLLALTVMRLVALHPFRRGKRDKEMWQRAGELAVTPLMLDAGFTLPPDALYDARFRDHAAEQVFAILEREQPPPSGGQGGGQQGGAAGASQIDDAPPKDDKDDTGQAHAPRQDEQDWRIAGLQAEMAAKKRGQIPLGADRVLNDIRRPRENPWLILRRFISSAARADYRWTPPNRRYLCQGLVLPSLRSEQVGEIAIWIDTSGSIGADTLRGFGGHLGAILEDVRPERTHVIYCDADVGKVETFEQDETLELRPDALRDVKGGGGTDCSPVFAYLEEHEIMPVCFVGLTDCLSRYPTEEPPFPALWGSLTPVDALRHTYGADYTPPFGEVVEIRPDDWE